MNTTLRCAALALALFAPSLDARELVKAKDGSGTYGYKDTPKLPWCEWLVHDPDRPVPPKVTPGTGDLGQKPPADATVLFDGADLSRWTDTSWTVVDGLLTAGGKQSPRTKETFGSFQLHLEWRSPADFDGPWHDKGNNGVLLHGLYEIQIFDSFDEPLYPDPPAGAPP